MALQRFVVMYVQEVTQQVQAAAIEDAGAYARKHAAHNHGLRVLQIYPAPLGNLTPGLPPPAAA